MVVLVGVQRANLFPSLDEDSRTGALGVSFCRRQCRNLGAPRSELVQFEGRSVALVVELHPKLHPKRQSQVSEDRFDLIQRLAAKVLDFQQFLLGALR